MTQKVANDLANVKNWFMSHLAYITLVVRDGEEALALYVGKLGFTLVEETCISAQDERWVTIRPLGAL